MSKPRISIIVAITAKDRAIGKGNDLIVHIGDDLKERFKKLTMGHPIIMGRKTYESIGKPLPGRTNIIVTRNPGFKAPGTVICMNLDEAVNKASEIEMKNAADNKEIFIVGGGEIYSQSLPKTDRLYLTVVETEATGDVFFPDYSGFKTILKREDRVDQKTGLKYSWIDLER